MEHVTETYEIKKKKKCFKITLGVLILKKKQKHIKYTKRYPNV